MIAFLVSVKLHVICYHLLVCNIFKSQEIRLIFIVEIVWLWAVSAIEEPIGTTMRPAHWRIDCSVRNSSWSSSVRLGTTTSWLNSFELIFKVPQLAHDFTKLSLPLFFLNWCLTDREHPLFVHKVARSWPSCKIAIYTFPMLFEIWLDVLQAIECWHLAWLFLRCWLRRGLTS